MTHHVPVQQLLSMAPMPKIAVTDCFHKAAALLETQPGLWGVLVRDEETVALHDYMMRLLARKSFAEISDPENKAPYFERKIKSAFRSMVSPLEKDASVIFGGQQSSDTNDYIGVYHSDRMVWTAFLSTTPTATIAIQQNPPWAGGNTLYFSPLDVMALDPNTILFAPEPGTAVILRGMGERQLSAFHMIPRCPEGQARLCVAAHAPIFV